MKAGSLVSGMGAGKVPGEGKDESKCSSRQKGKLQLGVQGNLKVRYQIGTGMRCVKSA